MALFLRALRCENSDARPPVWLMRQAGRYLPEYRALREKHSFLQLCHQPELAAEVTVLPFKRFALDAAIVFSDILVIPEALGMGLHFDEGKGPLLDNPIKSVDDINRLPKLDVKEQLGFVAKTIALCCSQLSVPLIGFSGAPFTLASYMIEGGTSRSFKKTKQWMLREPNSFHQLLQHLTDCIIAYLHMQVKAGVHAIQIFDSWAHVLNDHYFRECSLKYLRQIVQAVPTVPVILFCRGSSVFAPLLAELNPAAISLDWLADIGAMRKQIPASIALQGNLDPDILYAPLHVVKREVQRMCKSMQGDRGYIVNLGHGIHPDISLDAVSTLVEAVHA